MAAVAMEYGEAEYTLCCGHVRGYATASGGYSLNGTSIARKHDHVVAIPRSSPAVGDITQRLRGAAASGNLPKLALREESDLAAVGRPEGEHRVLSVRHWLGLKRVQSAEPELTLPIYHRRDCEVTTIRGNSNAVNASRVFRQRNGVALCALRCRLRAEVK